ncbi:MAG: HAD-IA family hydrolase [Azoarcus sp.]|jgi:phosphoglycolate phosphatase|nr:HAD-IA family hydrolase [Azoarcus sp.]
MNFDLIVFDWDGTLMDSTVAIARAIQAASIDLGLPPPSDERARHVIGLGLSEALAHVVPDLAPRDYHKMSLSYRRHYLAFSETLALFPGVPAMLDWLSAQGHLLAVATGKSRLGLTHVLAQSGMGNYFHATRCADESISKPHPAMLEELMCELGVTAERTLMIGDTTHDLQMARNAGVAGIGVTYGAHPHDALAAESPLACIATSQDLDAWLRANV